VIGQPDLGVFNYDLFAKNEARVVKAPVQDLINATIVIENGATVMDFTRPLVSEAAREVTTDVTQFHIFAYTAGASELVEHSRFGATQLNLDSCTLDNKTGLTSVEKHALLMAVGESFFHVVCHCYADIMSLAFVLLLERVGDAPLARSL
jgi:hypothetical protein